MPAQQILTNYDMIMTVTQLIENIKS